MNSSLLARLQKLNAWQQLGLFGVCAILLTEVIVSAMDLLLIGEVNDIDLIIGMVAASIVAPLGWIMLRRLLKEFCDNQLRQAESIAKISSETLDIAFTANLMLVWELDFISGELRYEDRRLGLLGIDTNNAPHNVEGWIALIHPDDQPSFIEHFQAALHPDSPLFDFEYRCALLHDAWKQSGAWDLDDTWNQASPWGWIHTRGVVVRRDAAGKPLLAVGVTRNVNARKQAEIQFHDAQKRFELIFNSSPDVMVISRLPEGIITDVNDAFVINTGYTKQEAIGNTTVGLGFWSSSERQKMADAIRLHGYCRAMEFEFTLKDGQQRTGSFSAIVNKLQGIPHLVSTVHDITDRKRMENELKASETRFRAILEATPIPLALNDSKDNITYLNRAFKDNLGYTLNDIPTLDAWWPLAYPDPDYRSAIRESWLRSLSIAQDSNTDIAPIEASVMCKDGKARTFLIGGTHLQGDFSGLHLVTMFDITEQKRSETELADSKNLLQIIIDTIPVRVFWKDRESRYLGCNPAFARDAGLSNPAELIGKNDLQLSWKDQAELYRADDRMVMKTGQEKLGFEEPQTTPDGQHIWLRTSKIPLRDQNRNIVGVLGTYEDITEKKHSEELIWTQANFDPLTHLPNRRMFRDRLAQDLKKAHRAGLGLALLFLDLDHFKEVNDTLGHDIGDALLIDAAYRITACVRESDTVARLGGDEFTIILAELDDVGAVGRIAEDIIHALNQPFHLNDDTVYVSASIGITLYPDDGLDLETLVKNADQAMFAAKQSGRNRYSYFTRALQEDAKHRQQLISDMRIALSDSQFKLYYQPIIELKTGTVLKAECLLRWPHPEHGFISPGEFIPLAEDSGLIHELGDWVFSEMAQQLSHCHHKCAPGFQLSVNVSPVQFHDTLKLKKWLNMLKSANLRGENIVIEITEGLLLDTSTTVTEQLLAFRDAGIQVAIDDFGTGYSALSYLNKLDIDYLKIDQSFTRNLAPHSSDMALVEAIIVMAHKLGLKVIAEGVETAEQNELLSAVECDYVQGYYYSKPLPAEELEAWLRARRASSQK